MFSYLVNRMFVMIPTLLAISVLVFVIIQLPPGDFLTTYINELLSQGEAVDFNRIEALKQEYGFDKPMYEQYFIWLIGLLQGDLGWSFAQEIPVVDILREQVWLTVILNFATVFFVYLVAFPIGIYSATHQYSWGDYGLSFIGFIGLATPNFLLALILLYLFNVWFGISVGGLMAEQYLDQPWSWGKLKSVLAHLIVPTIVIGTSGTAAMIRRLRANMLDELQKQYVVTGRAKGLPPFKLLMKYPLRMALNPFIADIGSLLPQMVSGSVIVSVVMSLPTVGPTLLDALYAQDMYLAGSILMVLALLTVIGMLLSDFALALLDPRIRLGGGAVK